MRWELIVWLLLFLAPTGLAKPESGELDEAIWLATIGEYEPAIVLFEASLKQKPDDPVCNYFAGVSHFFLGDLEQASLFLERSVESRANFPQAYYWLAQVLSREGENEQAIEVTKAGLQAFPENEKLLKLGSKLRITTAGRTSNDSGINVQDTKGPKKH